MGLFGNMLGLPAGIAQGIGGMVDLSEEEYREALQPQHKSPMGIGGQLRDILGGLGDALLIANDADPSYRMKRDAERIGDAMGGYQEDPYGTIGKIAGVSPKIGREYLNDYLDNEVARNKEDNRANEKLFLNGQKYLDTVGGVVSAANPQTWPALREQMITIGSNHGMQDFAATLPPPNATAEELRAFANSTMKVKDQRFNDYRSARLAQFEQGLGLQQERNDISRQRNTVLERQGSQRLQQGERRLDQADTREDNDEAYREWRKHNAPPSSTGGGGTPRPSAATSAPREGQVQYGLDKKGNRLKRTFVKGKWVTTKL